MSCATITSLSLLFFLLLVRTPIATSSTTFFTCSPRSTYPPNGNYSRTLLNLLTSLVRTASLTGFTNLTAGTMPPDIIYGLALCRGDLNSSICSDCLRDAAIDVISQCPGSLSGAVWYDRCRLRYSDGQFFSTLTPNPDQPYFYDLRRFDDPLPFRSRFEKLARDLQRRAAFGNSTGMYATGSTELGASDRLYGMVQCTRDVNGEQCAQCLEVPIRQISCCESNVEITYQGGSCYLRYAMYQFYNESVVAPPVEEAPPPSTAGNVSTEQPGPFTLNTGGKKHHYFAIVAIVIGIAILALLLLIAYKASKKKKSKHILLGKTRDLPLVENNGPKFNRPLSSSKFSFHKSPQRSRGLDIQKLDMQTLKIATENFSENKRIGRGEFGVVYKGDLPGQEFVVKRFTAKSKVELAVLQGEFRTFSKLNHPNIVKLLAFYIEKEGGEKLVVYEHLPNTSLDRILFDAAAGKFPSNSTFNKSSSSLKHTQNRSRPPRYPEADNRRRLLLDWGRRFKIIQGVAQGLLHLHGEGGLNIIHGNLKASNILLDKQMEPKISDFCLPRLFECSNPEQKKKSSALSGYVAPECIDGTPSAKADVFSYGVLVLEIITGQKNRDLLGSESSTNLLSYVWQYYREEKSLQVLDWSLGELYKGHEVLRSIHVGLLCVQEDPEKRPNMASVVDMLNSFSFTLPTPTPPAAPNGKKNGSGPLNGSGTPANWDWKLYNQNSGLLSPTSNPSGWADAKLESR